MASKFWLRASILLVSGLVVGCEQVIGVFGVTPEERGQINAVRAFRRALSLDNNLGLAIFQREASFLLGMNLPTEYGIPIQPLLAPFPSVTPRLHTGVRFDVDPSTRELRQIFLQQPTTFITSTVSQNQASAGQSWRYLLNLTNSPNGTTGTLDVTTTGTNWPARTISSQPYVLGLRVCTIPTAFRSALTLNLPSGQGVAKLTADLSQFDGMVAQRVSVNGAFPKIPELSLTGRYSSPTMVTLSGTMKLQTDKALDAYTVLIQGSNGNLRGVFTNTADRMNVEVRLEGGSITGSARSTAGLQRKLADIVTEGGNVMFKFADGTTEAWQLRAGQI